MRFAVTRSTRRTARVALAAEWGKSTIKRYEIAHSDKSAWSLALPFRIDNVRWAPDGKLLMSWGEPGTKQGQFNIVHNICCDEDGWVYVADRENHRVQVFNGQGKFEAHWHNMHRPCGLCMTRGKNAMSVEQLTYAFTNVTAEGGELTLLWGKEIASVPFTIAK